MDADTQYDEQVIESTDWARIEAHRPAGKTAYSMSAEELRAPCVRPGCSCRWS